MKYWAKPLQFFPREWVEVSEDLFMAILRKYYSDYNVRYDVIKYNSNKGASTKLATFCLVFIGDNPPQ